MQDSEQGTVYRAAFAVAAAIVFALIFIIVGLAMVLSSRQVGVSGVAIGVIALLAGGAIGALTITNRMVVDSETIVYWHNFRKTVIPWQDVRSFGIGMSKSFARWPCLVIYSSSGKIRIDAVAGTRNFVGKKILDLEQMQRERVRTSG